MATRQLSIDLEIHPTDAEDGPYRLAIGQPFLDGQPLGHDQLFGLKDVLLLEDQPGQLDVFTCSCGAAGCAGFHDTVEVLLAAEDTQVIWTFPEEGYRAALNPALFPAEAPLQVCFDRAHYRAVLADLESRLLETESHDPTPLLLHDADSRNADARPLAERLAAERESYQQWQADCRWRKTTFAELLNYELQATWADGTRWGTSLENLLYAYVESRSSDGAASRQDLEALATRVRQNPLEAQALAASLPLSDLLDRMWELEAPEHGTLRQEQNDYGGEIPTFHVVAVQD